MKLVKRVAVGAIVLALLVFAAGHALPRQFVVVRSTVIDAPADKVYGFIADPRAWRLWSAWARRDPAMEIVYSGPQVGPGARWSWKSRSQGEGSITFADAQPGRRIAYELFFPSMGTMSTGVLDLVPQGGATRVRWTMHGDAGDSPLYRWFGVFADRLIGADFEEGLANLKALAEQP